MSTIVYIDGQNFLYKVADQVFYLENQQVIDAYLKSLNR